MLCISRRQLANLVDQGLPKRGNGRESYYVWPEVFQWYVSYKVDLARPKREQQEESEPEDGQEEYKEALTRRTRAEADLRELELSRERAEVVAVADVEKNIAAVASAVKTKLLGLPSKLVSIISAQKTKAGMRAVLDSEMRQICSELATIHDGESAGVHDNA